MNPKFLVMTSSLVLLLMELSILKVDAADEQEGVYSFYVKTDDVNYAGTDRNVYVQFNNDPKTKTELNSEDLLDDMFEEGSCDVFMNVKIDHKGPITSLQVWTTSSVFAPLGTDDWKLYAIKVFGKDVYDDPQVGMFNRANYVCNCWITDNDEEENLTPDLRTEDICDSRTDITWNIKPVG